MTPIGGDLEELVAQFAVATGEIRDMPEMFQNIWNSMFHRREAYIEVDGRNFEHYR